MNIRYLFLTVAFFSIIFTGCNNEEVFLVEDDFFISPDKAEFVATRIAEFLPYDSSISGDGLIIDFNDNANQGVSSMIRTTYPVNDKNGKPAFYIVNYEKGGFIILSADIRMGPVLSISETGYFEVTADYPEGLNRWMSNIKENTEILRDGNFKVDEDQKLAWEAFLNMKKDEITTRSGDKDPLEYMKITDLKHIMHLKWNHHGDGYNDSVPHNCPNNPGGKAYVGCVPVTVGQILRHWEYPESYEWDKMPASYATPTTAKFLVDIGKDVEVFYTCNSGSGSYMDIAYALRMFYGYSATNDFSYTYEELRGEIDINRPVILSGPAVLLDGNNINHAWICEGYMEYMIEIYSGFTMDKDSEEKIVLPRKMLYMNWGWNEYNGWYSNEKLLNGEGRFYIQEMIKNIYPKAND